MPLASVLSFLDEYRVQYRLCHFSPAHAQEDIEQVVFRLGMGLVEAVPLEMEGQGLILAVVPASLFINCAEFSNPPDPRKVRPLLPEEIAQRFAPFQSAYIPPFGSLFGVETFLSPLIEQYRRVGFFVDSQSTLITLDAPEFRRLLSDASAIPVPTRTRFRAYASPGRDDNDRCILGVSLENDNFFTAKLIPITDWIRNHFEHCVVMVGDGLHRITMQMDYNLPESEALEQSKWLARDFVSSQRSVFNLRQSNCRFDFVFCSEIQKTEDYLDYYRQLRALFQANREFKNSFKGFSHDFLQRKPQRRMRAEEHAEMSCAYLLEELAVLSCLGQNVPWTFVYPGSLTILEEIAEGMHPDVPAGLLQMDYVELNLKSR